MGLQSPEVLPKHDVCLTALGMVEGGGRGKWEREVGEGGGRGRREEEEEEREGRKEGEKVMVYHSLL